MEYTEAEHAANLIELLENRDPCNKCPCCPDCFLDSFAGKMCRGFIGVTEEERDGVNVMGVAYKKNCPCNIFGHHEAIKRTWLALEAKGYLD